jgi:hypothetical protein
MGKTVVVSGALANRPGNAGGAWVRLSWLQGLRKLGYRVYFLEQLHRAACVDSCGDPSDLAASSNCDYFRQVVNDFGFAGSAALITEDAEVLHGPPYDDLVQLARSADLLINISGHLTLEGLFRLFRPKAYVDLDPGFTQIWHTDAVTGASLAGHDFYFTTGENIGTPACSIPDGHIPWQPIRQPIVLDEWPVLEENDGNRFTTIASWRGAYGPINYNGETFGTKAHEFRKFVGLPVRTGQSCEIALQIHPKDGKDMDLLRQNNWRIVNPLEAIPDPAAFRKYVQHSYAEFSVAQGIYVQTNSGWFSDRTVRYLASGKPVLVQDTGFTQHYLTGQGLLSFRTLEQAIAGVREICRDYAGHCQAARALAEKYFGHDRVIGSFMEDVGLPP